MEDTTADNIPAVDDGAKPAPRKRPGRPRKVVQKTDLELNGIVPKPEDESHVVELVYSNPALFKKITQMCKLHETGEITMRFTSETMTISARDHVGKSDIKFTIYGKCMNLYYCREPVSVCVRLANLQTAMTMLGKNTKSITIILGHDYRSNIHLSLHDPTYDGIARFTIDTVRVTADQEPMDLSDDDYPLRFTVSLAHLKSLIGVTTAVTQTINIQHIGGGSLQMSINKQQGMDFSYSYNSDSKIRLKSTIDPDDIFSVGVSIQYIRPFANSNVGEEVEIAVDKQKKISFTSHIDETSRGCYACCVKVFTETACA